MIAIGVINIITIPLISKLGNGSDQQGYLLVAILYGIIFALCHIFCFAKTKEAVTVPEKKKIPIKLQIKTVAQNKPYLLALIGQFLFGVTLYGRNADALYYFKYVEGSETLFTTYSLVIIIPSIIGAGLFQILFKLTENKGRTASILAFCTGVSMLSLYLFSPVESAVAFYIFSGLTQFFFAGFNTAIYAIIPDCVEYGEWKTGIRNDGFQYAFISLGNKIGMAIGTSVLAAALSCAGFEANIKHSFSTIPGVLWIITAVVLFFYRLNKKSYNKIVDEIKERKAENV